MAVYAYLRVSTGKQDGENQKNGIDDFAKKRGFVIDEYIDDEGKSGTLEPEKRELGNLMKKHDLEDFKEIIDRYGTDWANAARKAE